jgi:hypothetical protein
VPPFAHQVSAVDDQFHSMPEDSPFWSESAQFTCYDEASGVAAYVHWGLLGREIWEALFALYLPNGEIMVSRTFAPRLEGESMRTGEAEIYPIVPLESWRMRYDGVARRVLMADLAAGPLTDGPTGRVKVDLIGTATTPAFGKGVRQKMEAQDNNLAVSGSGLHIEQSTHVTGSVEIHGEVIHFNAVGHRDHSCGPRHNSHMWRESWVNGSFPDGRIFHCVQVFVTGRPVYFMGYVWRGTEFLPVTDYSGPLLTGTLGEPRDFTISFNCEGRREQIVGELLGALPITLMPQGMYPGTLDREVGLACEGPARWVWDGQVGYGWIERVFSRGGWPQIRARDRAVLEVRQDSALT